MLRQRMDNLNKIANLVPPLILDRDPGKGKSVSKRHLINKLNFLNFQDEFLLVNFKHKKYGNITSLTVRPLPCSGDKLDCAWVEPPDVMRILRSYALFNLLVAVGSKLLLVNPEMLEISDKGIEFLLPETCSEVSTRKLKRHPSAGVEVQIVQNGAVLNGSIQDFTPVAVRVEVKAASPQMGRWINLEFPVNLNISAGERILYSGTCRIIRHAGDNGSRTLVLEPVHTHMRRFSPKKYRSTRQELVPSPDIVFVHPFCGKTVSLKVVDLSGTGFAVEEDECDSILLPGMIIPELELSFAGSIKLKCQAQVVYRHVRTDEGLEGVVRCGLAILDMEIDDHIKLLSILHHAANGNSYICSDIDLDELWNFFFESGFIYPEKYANFQANKEAIKRTYERLYSQSPHIARHFICQEKGTILGHMSMVRFYDNSWLIQHHAATKTEHTKAGLTVLNQIGRFINDSHNLYSAHMQYVFCYFRPDNKFPDRIFGGMGRMLKDQTRCSLDTFAYFHFRRPIPGSGDLPALWEMTSARSEDLQELECFYRQKSGGLMLNVLDLDHEMTDRDSLSREYRKLGFKRESHLFSLKKNHGLKAVFIVNVSDIGLNMSNLTNAVKVIVLDNDDLPKEVLLAALTQVSAKYDENEVPVLVYPVGYAEAQGITYEKLYTMWILNMQNTDDYFRYLESMIKTIQH
jgi:hypothetical protein